jgi:hypothetical protein
MKFSNVLISSIVALASALPAYCQNSPLPNTGTYFIVNQACGEALQPVGVTPGQNVYVYPYDKGGRQKWSLTRQVNPKTHLPTDRYVMKLLSEGEGTNFNPHDMQERPPVLGYSPSTLQLKPVGDAYEIRSVAMNGDALCVFHVENSFTETRFKPTDNSDKFLWKFTPAER